VSLEEYAAHKTTAGAHRWQESQRDAEFHDQLKQAVHDALDERDAG
jgi:hypothetical protein